VTMLWSLGIAKDESMPKLFYLKELVSWCAKIFYPKNTIIEVGESEKTPVPLTPSIFKGML
jgi:hypothetical protein